MDVVLRTAVPFFLLVGLGYLSRQLNLIQRDGVKALSAYVYFFALPALFFVNLSELDFDLNLLSFLSASLLPLLVVTVLLVLLRAIAGISKDAFFLLLFCSVMGNYAFFGIPFSIFAFETAQAEYYASIAASIMSLMGITVGLVVLELNVVKEKPLSLAKALSHVLKRFTRNPLIIAIVLGLIAAVSGLSVPQPIKSPLVMLGATTSAVAIFMLGAFFHGRTYDRIKLAMALSLIRLLIMPALALLAVVLFELSDLEDAIVVIMHGMPLAIASVVLAERYRFHVHTITSLILITSLASIVTLNLWLLLFA